MPLTIIEEPVKKGIPLNAYKHFKFIDRNGNTYYLKKELSFGN